MSRLFPHPPYAEDQTLAHTILTTHVLNRAITMGSIIGAAVVPVRTLISRRRVPSNPTAGAVSALRPQVILRSLGVSTAWTIGIVAVGLGARMYGRERIEWQDRAWRLLENKGQLETDDWSYGGIVAGVVGGTLLQGGLRGLGWRGILGAAGSGSALGVGGYMLWRYGVKKGKFE